MAMTCNSVPVSTQTAISLKGLQSCQLARFHAIDSTDFQGLQPPRPPRASMAPPPPTGPSTGAKLVMPITAYQPKANIASNEKVAMGALQQNE